ncbi:lytic transglycosylase domain-containing protein [Sandaracinobacter sp. RS1-74]|uniref:lytic transglycosylase domain-containing protein n=1 Tax=Sandaracinobacteroides sayramensis TaxID=2913411 RepID=UPI001EDA7BB5|nr:lytic transglycosylase domain-containing protein [Sandaracinobacteroides sayramensis]MCG2842477.1 lytic transglycosylase domain-containing protein [Sandaracinobacteroides sayramensis]
MPVQYRYRATCALLALLLSPAPLLAQAPAPPAPPAPMPQEAASRAWLQQQFAAYDARSGAAPQGAPSQIAQSLATWDWLRRVPAVGAEPPLDAQARFLTAHADWPGTTAIRRRAETQAADANKTSDGSARAFFQQVAPQSSAGQARYALVSSGPEAETLARAAWVRPSIPAELESALLTRFGPVFTAADHAQRADALIWAGQTSAAQRIVPLLDDENRALAQARIALRANAADAEARVASVPARLRRNAGLAHDRAIWLERRGRLSEAEALLAAGDTDAGATAPETWLEKRLAMGRAAMRRGEHQTAYRILANHKAYPAGTNLSALPLSQRVDLSDTEWLAGWIALRKLARFDNAQKHFNEFNRVVTTPISQTRGDYWLGRAEKARGQPAAAQAAFERAATHFDYYYGQLATEELGRTPELPMVPRIQVSPADRAKFESKSVVQALKLLNDMGAAERASLFVRAAADSAGNPVEARAAAELGQRMNRPDLGVWTWKNARPGSDLATFDLAFPRLPASAPIPAREWIISHAIARQESSFDRTALSHAGARGLMQLMPATAQDVANKLGLPYSRDMLFSDPAYNLRLGSYYIGLRRDNFSNAMMAIAAYNAGAGNVRKWIGMNGDPRGATAADLIDWVEMIPITETRNYVQRVSENAVVYSLLEPKRQGARPRVSDWLKNP